MNNDNGAGAVSIAKSILVWLISAVLLLGIFAFIAYGTKDSDAITAPLVYAALILSSIIGGFAAAKFSGGDFITSVFTGLALMLLVMLLSFLPAGDAVIKLKFWQKLLLLVGVAGTAMLGGFIGTRRTKPKRHSARHVHRR